MHTYMHTYIHREVAVPFDEPGEWRAYEEGPVRLQLFIEPSMAHQQAHYHHQAGLHHHTVTIPVIHTYIHTYIHTHIIIQTNKRAYIHTCLPLQKNHKKNVVVMISCQYLQMLILILQRVLYCSTCIYVQYVQYVCMYVCMYV